MKMLLKSKIKSKLKSKITSKENKEIHKYVIVAETGSDIPRELAEEYGIYLVPMHVTFGNKVKDDGTFPPEEVCTYYEKTGQIPKTSGCNPDDFIDVFGEIMVKDLESHIIYMAYSAVTTCSFQSAKLAVGKDDSVSFIDTKHVSIGQCAAVIRMAQKLREHPEWNIAQVEHKAREICESVKMCFVPSNLDFLKAGGRVSNATALCGNILGIRPKIELINGYLRATKKYRGRMKKVIQKLIEDFCVEHDLDKSELWMGYSVGFVEELKEYAVQIAQEKGFKKVNWIQVGGVITTHGGPNAFCMAGFVKGK